MSYINTEKFKERLEASPLFANFGADGIFIRDFVRDLVDGESTADVVEVVRCRDCKHFTKGMAIGMCKRIDGKPIVPCRSDNYCMFGKRRE